MYMSSFSVFSKQLEIIICLFVHRLVSELNNSCEMDIKEELPLSDDKVSQNETDFFMMKRNTDDDTIKTEIKSETPFTKHLVKVIKCETVTCSNKWQMDMKTEIEEQTVVSDFGSQNEEEFLTENPVMKLEKFSTDHEIDNKIEIKEEPLWLETETSSVCDSIKVSFIKICLEL